MAKRVFEAIGVFNKNKYLILLILCGALLLVFSGTDRENTVPQVESDDTFSVRAEEERLEKILSQIQGAGKVSVMLSVNGSGEKIPAINTESAVSDEKNELNRTTVVIDSGSEEKTVILRYEYPEYVGAVVVASGADTASVRLRITEAVADVTGINTDRITVVKMK